MSDCPEEQSKMSLASASDIKNVLAYFSKECYQPQGEDAFGIDSIKRCIELMNADYNTLLIDNQSGELSPNYPSQIIILEHEMHVPPQSATNTQLRTTNTIYESLYDVNKLRDLFNKARFARCRMRFPVPVILYKGKYICRSATLSGGPEIYGRTINDYLFYGGDQGAVDNVESSEESSSSEPSTPVAIAFDWQLFDKVRGQDIKLLKTLNVGTIVDFMVEKKKVKYYVNVSSSEKVDKVNRYADFALISLPYPGCEFFRDYKDNNYGAEGLVFDWNQSFVDATIYIPEDYINNAANQPQNPTIDWAEYKQWDLVQITQNYLRLILRSLQDQSSGLLIHCISGWDRTPLFVSLLRLSLWADGLVHQSLDATEILYLTVTYDWLLFGHRLVERLGKGEEIFFFCFYMLKHLVSEEFSVLSTRLKTKTSSVSGVSSSTANPRGDNSPIASSNTSPPHPSTDLKLLISRADSDLQLDGGLVMLENDPRGSNVSLNSLSSNMSNKSASQELQPAAWVQVSSDDPNYANGNVSVALCDSLPLSQQSLENGNASDGSSSSMVSASTNNSGSASSAMSACTAAGLRSPQTRRTSPVSVPSAARVRKLQDSSSSNASIGSWQMISGTGSLRSGSDSSSSNSAMVIEDESGGSSTLDAFATRRQRLMKVREVFYTCYHATIGFKFVNDPSFAAKFNTMAGNLAGNLGFTTDQA